MLNETSTLEECNRVYELISPKLEALSKEGKGSYVHELNTCLHLVDAFNRHANKNPDGYSVFSNLPLKQHYVKALNRAENFLFDVANNKYR